ncbi:DUF3631 domain-containing protein [Acidipropionibacterium jensenii]|uniref:DUF3631 domain-containing protein n=1 Tax=Acidipropionibacterium jensenii TaxID=1749 RepID=UPI00110C07F1|nr:DUF3631 domain-containing protein [Acidipropionibacterium jensenii]QCV88208.1 DUF3631 domain-containing protein [Acidipropionibacterium jensenii]
MSSSAIDRAVDWLSTYITVTEEADIWTLALWAQHTWSLDVLPVSPRLLIDSIMPGSGKTTVLDHLQRLCRDPSQMSQVTSSALLVRLIAQRPRTLLLDEVDRALDPRKDTTSDLLAILNSGYKRGATRPVLTPTKGGDWTPVEMPTYCAAAMAGNSPRIPDDTRSRSLRIFLLPDMSEEAAESDWLDEDFEMSALTVGDDMRRWSEDHADQLKAARPDFPPGCRGRMKERWVSFARIAQVLGGGWPDRVSALIQRDINTERLDKEDGMTRIPPAMQAILDVADILAHDDFKTTSDIVDQMIDARPDMWGEESSYGRKLTWQRLGKMLAGAGLHSWQPTSGDRRKGYRRADVQRVATKLKPSGSHGLSGLSGCPGGGGGTAQDPSELTAQTAQIEQTAQDDECPRCHQSLTRRSGSNDCAYFHKQAQRGRVA